MTWPEALPIVAVAVGVAASVAGLAWTLGRIFRPWVGDVARKEVDRLYERLKTNDFPHLEDRIADVNKRLDDVRTDFGERLDAVRTDFGARLDAVRTDFGARLDRMDRRATDRHSRILAALDALAGRGSTDTPSPDPESPEKPRNR